MTPPTANRATSDRWALWVFAVVVVVAVPAIFLAGRQQWFFLDEWQFLANRDASSIDGLLQPHNGHWATIPIVIYRVLWRFVGLHHYWPYQVPLVAANLASVVMLRVLMMRSGSNPWLATFGASSFAVFGTGAMNILWGFQITMVGSLAFGLASLLLVDHLGDFDRRDGLGMVFGLAALMCSAIGVVMVAVVAGAVLLRRGWRCCLLIVGPLAATYLAWSFRFSSPSTPLGNRSVITLYFRRMLVNTLVALGGHWIIALALTGVLAGGTWVASRRYSLSELGRRYGVVLALAGGAVLFSGIVAANRAPFGGDPAPRYLHIAVALLLPLLVVSASITAERWPRALVPLGLLFLAGIPSNVMRLYEKPPYLQGRPTYVMTLAQVAARGDSPRGLAPNSFAMNGLTMGWLADGVASGRIPPPPIDERTRRMETTLMDAFEGAPASATLRCTPVPQYVPTHLEPGDRLRVDSVVVELGEVSGQQRVDPIPFVAPTLGPEKWDLRAVRPITVWFTPAGLPTTTVCR